MLLHCSWAGQCRTIQLRLSPRSRKPRARRCCRTRRLSPEGSQEYSSPWTHSRRNWKSWRVKAKDRFEEKWKWNLMAPQISWRCLSLATLSWKRWWSCLLHNISWGVVSKLGHHREGGAMEVFSHVRVLAKQGLLDDGLVEPLQLLVHPWEEEQGHLLHQDKGEDLSKSWLSNIQIYSPRASWARWHT